MSYSDQIRITDTYRFAFNKLPAGISIEIVTWIHGEIDAFQQIGGRLNAFFGKAKFGGCLVETVNDG